MKQILAVLLIGLTSSVLFSQPEFKITVDEMKWEDPSSNRVTLTIFLTIKNVGSEKGWCEDLNGIYIDCSNTNYYYNTHMKLVDYSRNIVNDIKPGGQVEAFISYEVPKDADDISLRFTEFYGGATRYLTQSYNKSIEKQNEGKFDTYVSEGDERMSLNYPEEAINLYKMALETSHSDSYKTDEVKQKLGRAYEKVGDKNADKKIWGFAIEEYKLALEYTKDILIKEKIAVIYKQIGDEKLSAGSKKEAVANYDLSLKYKEDTQLRIKRNEMNDEIAAKEKKEKAEKKAWNDYQKLLNPKVGFKLGGGLSFQQKGSGKTGTFWTANLSAIPKIFVNKATAFTFALNVDFSATGMLSTTTSNGNFNDYYGLGDSLVDGNGNVSLLEYSLSAGPGLGFLSNSFSPFVFVSYGAYALLPTFNLYDGITYSSGQSVSEMYWGHGFKAELLFLVNRKIYFSYTFKSYQVTADKYDFIDGRYTGHIISIGALIF